MTLLDDAFVRGSGGTHPVVEPATGAVLGRVGIATPDDVAEAAAKAQRDWARRKPAERAAVLRRAGELWETHAAEVQDWIVREAGSTRPKAGIETEMATGICFEAAALPTHPLGEVLSPAWREEIFGPVAPVRAYLGDVGTAMKPAEEVRSGKVHINEQTVGGVGDSGNGSRFGGAKATIEAFTETQW